MPTDILELRREDKCVADVRVSTANFIIAKLKTKDVSIVIDLVTFSQYVNRKDSQFVGFPVPQIGLEEVSTQSILKSLRKKNKSLHLLLLWKETIYKEK